MDSLVKKAYENWVDVIEYDGKALMNTKSQSKRGLPSRVVDAPAVPAMNYSAYDQQLSLSTPLLPQQHAPLEHNLSVGGNF